MTGDSTAERTEPLSAGEIGAADAPPMHRLSSAGPDGASSSGGPGNEVSNPYRRMEQLLSEIRAHLDASARESRVREFSLARLVAALLQALVVGLVVWAASDWVFAMDPAGLWIKLGFAVVLQLGVIAALLGSQDRAKP